MASRQQARTRTVPAPVGGWNARDALADMRPEDAVILDNFFPSEGKVELRKGARAHVTGLGGWVETLLEYEAGANRQLLAAANGTLYDASSATAQSLGSGFSNDRWAFAQMDDRLGLVNGVEARQWNGSTLSALTVTGPSAPVGIHVYKGRSYFWDAQAQSFWYSAPNALGGALTEFPLGRVSPFGGNLKTMATWSRDGGEGVDDFAVFLFTSGDLAVYAGSDPGDAANWSLVGTFRLAEPVGFRPTQRYGGDVVVTTSDGYVSLTEVISRRKPSISNKIRSAAQQTARLGASLYGWETVYHPAENMLLFNVPESNTMSCQHVVNTVTGAWCRFKGWHARAFVRFKDALYFGGNGTIYKALSGTTDAGAAIQGDGLPAFSNFGSANLKQVTAVQPYLETNGALELSVITERDFDISPRPPVNLSTGSSNSPWGSPWGSPWSAAHPLFTPTKTVTQVGRSLSARLVCNIKNHSLSWYATTYFYKNRRLYLMAWDGSGQFNRSNGTYNGATVWQQDEGAAVDIEADRHDVHDQDLADGIEACLAKNGENAMTGDLDMGGHALTRLQAGSIDYADLQDVSATDRILGRSSAGAGEIEEIPCTAAGRALLDDADAAAQRTTLGLGGLATQDTVDNGDWSGADLAVANGGTGASNAIVARQNLGLGALAVKSNVDDNDWSGYPLSLAHGGTGGVDANSARNNLQLRALATRDHINNADWQGRDLSVSHGGTGASNATGARANLGIGSMATRNVTIQSGGSPSGGANGDIVLIY